jgi:alpha-mannosidase
VFDGYTYFEPWLNWRPSQTDLRLLDEHDGEVPFQITGAEAAVGNMTRLLFSLRAQPGERRVLRVDRRPAPDVNPPRSLEPAEVWTAAVRDGASLDLRTGKLQFPDGQSLDLPQLELIEDPTDTWSHDVDHYAGAVAARAAWEAPQLMDAGPLMFALVQRGAIGRSTLLADYRVYAGLPCVELRLRVHWSEQHKALKLAVAVPGAARRWDGIPGAGLERACDGRERPVRDWTLVELPAGKRLGVVCPDVFGLDGDGQRLRLTLLRSPLLAHHCPHSGEGARYLFADQGEHEFRFQFWSGPEVTAELLDQHATMLNRPLIGAEVTRGMPT